MEQSPRPASPQAVPRVTHSGLSAADPFESPVDMKPQGRIDELVFSRLAHLGIRPARVCSDAVFVRRAFLDVIGTLPTADEARAFLQDRSPTKRRDLVDRLLQRDEYAEYWSMKWSDLLRIKAEFPIDLWPEAVEVYHHWVRDSLRANMPYDRFVRVLLTSSGSNFRTPPVNFYRAIDGRTPDVIARAVALTFMGVRADKWPKARLAGMAGFFSQVEYKHTDEWKEEIVEYDPAMPMPRGGAVFPDGKRARLVPDRDPREIFAEWLISPKNPWFVRNIVNRVWYWVLGRGVIMEPDDIRPNNPPSNPELLAWLEHQFVADRYDFRRLFRAILTSKTYQLSSIARSKSPAAAANFASYPLRRLDAEVLIDAIDQITDTTEKYYSAIPEPFTWIPESQRSIDLADGSTTSAFLEMFGRPSRDSGLESERNNRSNSEQRLHLLNSSHIRQKIDRCRFLAAALRSRVKQPELIAEIYLTTLSRYPTAGEVRTIDAYGRTIRGGLRPLCIDVMWALINSPEFLYRH